MKIDRSKVKKSTSEVSEECRRVIQFLKQCGDNELLKELEQINVWYFGKCELYHWIDVLDRFDGILATVAKPMDGKQWIFQFDVLVDITGQEKGSYQQSLIFHILKFTALLIEHSYARHLYNSIEHLIMLLDCADGNIILAVLNLIYVFSKRSNYLSRLPTDKKKILQEKLVDLAQTWGGLEAGCALDQCCSEDVPAGAGNVYFEYYMSDNQMAGTEKNKHGSSRFCIDLKNIHQISTSDVGEIMENIIKTRKIPENIQMSFYHRLRLAHAMTSYKKRLQFVQARLQALSILVYSNSTTHINALVYDGLIEEIVNTLKLTDENYSLSEVKASCLKTLTAIIHLDRNPRLQSIIDSTGAMSYHGFLPTLVRLCIQHMTNSEFEPFPQQLATSLFSFLYHLASYESGCESLVASGLIEPLLKVVLWPGQDDHITFVTRAVRVIDLITNLDMAAFQTHSGLNALVGRLESEVKLCSALHGPALPSTPPVIEEDDFSTGPSMEESSHMSDTSSDVTSTGITDVNKSVNSFNDIEMKEANTESSGDFNKSSPVQCLPQRAALLKSILNFLKKAIPDPAFIDNTRSLMDENLQNSLKMIISNAEYYGALLFLLATDVVTVFIFHEPSLLSSLQDSGLTWVVLRALIVKDVPATRENLASLPNTLSALCLNTRGLQAFVKCKPFERLFGILMSPEYLPAMKRRRSSDPQGDTAMNLGSAMDELMRHQPTLKTDAMKAIIQLLQQLSEMGSDLNIIAFHPTDKTKSCKASQKESDTTIGTTTNTEDPLSDDEMEEEYRSLLIRKQDKKSVEGSVEETGSSKSTSCQRKYVPVVDYVLNVTKFLDNILSNNGTDDHCVEFVRLNGLKPLYSLLKMPNFPLEFPLMPACQSISQVCKSIAMLSQENKVFKEGLAQLNVLTDELDGLYSNANTSGSVLLHELAATENPLEALYDSTKTPIVHAMSAIHAYINVFVFLSRGAQTDVRNMSIQQWGSELGKHVLEKLCTLYMKLVWESSTLLTLCTPNIASEEDLSFAADDLGKLTAKKVHKDDTSTESSSKKGMSQLTLLKWLLTSSSHLGRALAELFGLLVHQCVGSQGQRLRRHNPNVNPLAVPSPSARAIASLLTNLLMKGLSWECPSEIKVPRLRLTFYICSVGFSTPMLFDNMKNPYHLMLQEFQTYGGVQSLFKAFDVVLEEYIIGKSDEEIKTTVGIGEFLEGWLGLVNRLANTKYLFESTHLLPTSSFLPGYVPFDAAEFMTRVHKHSFNSIMKLWQQKVFKSSDNHLIAERILSIFCHIIKGESLLPEKFTQQLKQKQKNEKPATNSTGGGGGMYSEIYRTPAPTTFGVQQPEVNEGHVQRFVDMGFSQQHAREALIHSRNNFEAATEYLLTTPAPVLGAGTSPAVAVAGPGTEGMEIDMSEDDMMIQAIAMSLVTTQEQSGEIKDEPSLSTVATTNKEADKKMDESSSSKTTTDKLTIEDLQAFSGMMGECMKDIFYGSLELLDAVPSTVHTVCDLHLAMSKRNGESWRNESLRELTEQIMKNAQVICNKIVSSNETEQSLMKFLCESKEAQQLSARLHLFLLMSQGLGNAWATVLQNDSPFNLLIMLLKSVSNVLTKVKQIGLEVHTPDLLAPLILTFDQYEKVAMFAKRRRNREKSHTWKWFDDRSGRWCNYSASNNSSIDTAYQAGESTVRFTAGRRRYMVFFKTLVQINEDTGNRRPIMLDVMQSKKTEVNNGENIADAALSGTTASATGSSGAVDPMKEDGQKSSGKQSKSGKRKLGKEKPKMTDTSAENKLSGMSVPGKTEEIELPEGLNNVQIETVIEYCVDFISLQVNPSTLNAVMRLLLRFTREYEMALRFARRNGVQHLLNLTESSSFSGALSLASLLLRHIVEDVETMKHAVDRAVAFSASSGVPNMFCGVGQNSVGAKELHYLLRALGPIACRNAELYNESVMRIMRITTNSWRGQLPSSANVSVNTPQIVKVPSDLKSVGLNGNVRNNSIMEDFVHVLLSTLIERYAQDVTNKPTNIDSKASLDAANAQSSGNTKGEDKRKRSGDQGRSAPSRTPQLVLVRRLTGEHIDEEEMTVSASQQSMSDESVSDSPSTISVLDQEEKKPLLSLSVILRLLAELSKSYAAVARLIVDYTVDLGNFDSATRKFLNDGPILSFIFDCLLPHPSKDTSGGDSKDNKPNTVSNLSRQLLSVLGSYWHNVEIQNVFVTELKNSLSRTLHLPESKSKHQQLQALFNLITSMIETAAPISFSSHPPLHNTSFIKLLIKRGLISDLARIAHNLDLSSHDLVPTINVMLKPLEKLSNLANSQNLHPNSKQEKDTKENQTTNAVTSSAPNDDTTGSNNGQIIASHTSEQQSDVRPNEHEEMQDLEGIVEVMVSDRDEETGIFGETLVTSQTGDENGVERRIYITPNPMIGGSSENSSDSSDRDDQERLSDHGSRFDDFSGNTYPLNEDTIDSTNQQPSDVVSFSVALDQEETNEESDQLEVVTSSLPGSQDSEAFEDTIIIDRGDEDEATSPRPDINEDDGESDDDDEDETDDEDGNDDDDDDDDDEGSDMDADDTIAAADDAIIFDEGDDATDDVSDPFADLDDHAGALEFSFPQRPFTVHIPQMADTGGMDAQTRSAFLSHPLLVRSNEQAPRPASGDRSARGRAIRGERGLTRQHGNAIHIHGNSGSFARILIGEDMPSGSRVGGNSLGIGDDISLDMFGDGNHSASGLLNSVPSALSLWTAESRLLDGASIHDCVNALKPNIIQQLEKIQATELQEKIAEEKRKKEESKKNEIAKTESTTNGTTVSSSATSSETTITAETTSTSAAAAAVALESTTSSGTLVSSVLTSQFFPIENVTTTQTMPAERMDVSPISVDLPVSSLVEPASLSGNGTTVPASNFIHSSFETPAVSSTSELRQESEVDTLITPYNPMPEVLPNAPLRDGSLLPAITSVECTPASSMVAPVPTTAQSMSSILAVSSSVASLAETPAELPRMNRYRNENAQALTGGLGFTPQIPTSSTGETPRSELPSVAEILATPSDIPSLQQLRNSSLFPQTGSPSTPQLIRPFARETLLREIVPSPLSLETGNSAIVSSNITDSTTTSTMSIESGTSGNLGLAADLAAAIMSQLVTSSPTPSVTTTAQSVDAEDSPLLALSRDQTTTIAATTTQPSATATSTTTDETKQHESAATSTATSSESGSSTVLQVAEQIQQELEGLGIPDGVDPSFLAALPENIREEVLRDQFGIRLRSTANQTSAAGTTSAGAMAAAAAAANTEDVDPPQEVSPEFLAALPEEVQREVLEQQRLEQARFTAAQQRPEQPVDPGEFLRNLNPTLRRQVLADMDDSVLAVLPPELTNEAQGLRRELQQRRLQIQAERALTRSDFSQLLRHRGPGSGFQSIARLFPGRQINTWKVTDGHPGSAGSKKLGRQLLDPESLTCLLVLLFLNDSTLNASRLHRILRNLSYHHPTKHWIIFALISILRRTSSFHQETSSYTTLTKQQYATSTTTPHVQSTGSKAKSKASKQSGLCEEFSSGSEATSSSIQQSHWLSRTLNLAFGGCVNIFQLQKIGRKSADFFVTVHQQACLDVCKQTLEALSFLAKNFPSSFSPSAESDNRNDNETDDQPGPSVVRNKEYGTTIDEDSLNEFWDILVRLNSSISGLKGKATSKMLKDFPKLGETSSFVTSPLGQILSMLSHPVVKQSTMLTDKLLRLLAVISMSLPERPKHLQAKGVNRQHERAIQPPDNSILPPDNRILSPEIPHPIHTVTFADTDDILTSHEPMLPSQPIDEYADMTSAEAATVCSETASVASSLYVELPEIAEGTILTDVSYPRPGSIISAFSEGTVVQSDISGAIGEENIHPEQDADTMAMDVDTVSHPISDTSSGDNRSSPGLSMEHLTSEKEPSILIGQLRMAVNVLTTGTCSDEGLEDATTLLLQLSRTEPLTRDSILELLLEGAQETANCLRNEIKNLLLELKERNAQSGKSYEKTKGQKQPVPVIVNPSSSRSQPWRGRGGRSSNQARRVRGLLGQQMPRRNVPKPVIYDLHLPAMATLTTKRSSQSLFLRILKVILQLRDAAKKVAKKPQTNRSSAPSRPRGFRLLERLHHGGNSLREVVAALEADMEAMYEMIDRFGGTVSQSGSSSRNANQQSGDRAEVGEASSSSQQDTTNREANSQETGAATSSTLPAASEEGEEKKEEEPEIPKFPCLSSQLQLDDLWDVLGEALTELAETTDTNAVLVLQPAVESFFLVHGSEKEKKDDKQQKNADQSSSSLDVPPSPGPYSPGSSLSPSNSRHGSQSSSYVNLPLDTQKFLRFAETHRTVLNQILRQSSSQLSDGPFAVLVNHTRLLDFDIKRRYFRQELEKEDKGHRREDMAVHIRRDRVFEDSYRELHRRNSEDIKNRLYIVFDGEEGQDAGGLLREWYSIMAREMFNPNYALFTTSQGEKATYLPNRNSHFHDNHLSYFKFAGRIVAKAIYDNKLLDCYFTRSFYKHILSKPVTYTDMESEDYSFYQGLVYLLENHINDLGYELTFSLEVQRFGLNEVHDLKPNGRNIPVTEETKREYVKLVCIEKMTGSIRKQIDNFLEGFYEVIPKHLISIFDEQELELLIAGLPTIDIEDLKANTEYHKYTEGSLQIQWFWRALRSFDQADRAKFLQFVTGTSKVPLQGFSMLEGMNGVQKFQIHRDDRSTDRLPCAHTCFNQLDLPPYETYDKLFSQLLKAVQECTEGFGLA